MFRRILLLLPVLSALLSADARPTVTKHDEHHLDARRESFAPVLVPVGEPAMLLGRHYQVVKRDPSPLGLPPALASQLAQAKGEAPPVPSAPAPPPGKRGAVPMPRYIYERDTYGTNYLSNVGPPPGPYPGYKPYESQPPPPPPPASSTASALDGVATRSPDDKKADDGGEKKAKAEAKGVTSKTYKSKQTKHKSE